MRTAVAACAAALLAAGCGGGRTGALQLHACTIGGSKAIAAECGNLSVPENPGDPNGHHIPIHVAVVRATGPTAKPDPLFYFSGWGSAGVEDDAQLAPLLVDVNLDHDVVFIDQRGTGLSNRLTCTPPSGSASLAAVTVASRRCAARIGPNLRYYTSAVAVDDYDRVRAALGYDHIDIYGVSYGVTTALIYLQRHGAHVRSVVLDSGSLLDVRIFEQEAPNAQRALDLLFKRCAVDASCSSAYPHLRADYGRLTARVARAPIPIPGTTAKLDEVALASVVESLLAFDKPELPRVVELVSTGHLARAAAIVAPLLPSGQQPYLAYQLLIQCSEPWASWRPAQVARLAAGTFLERMQLHGAAIMGAVCKGFPRGYAPAAIGRRVHSQVPVLFLQGDEDPADPPANVTHPQRELPNSRVVVFRASGHGHLSLPCAENLIARFVAEGSAAGLDPTCASSAAIEVQFDVPPS